MQIEELQNLLDQKKLNPNDLSREDKAIIDELIRRGDITGPTMSELSQERKQAASDLAREKEFQKDPIATALAAEDSFLKGRPTAVLAGDLTGSIYPYLKMKNKIFGAAKSGNLWQKGPGIFARNATKVADKLPGRFKLFGTALKTLARVADAPAKVVASPLGRAEIYSVLGGTAGAGVGSITYDMLNEQAGTYIASAISDDFADVPKKEVDADILLNSSEEMKTALMWNSGAALLTPFLLGPLGKLGRKLFGTKGQKQKELADFARDKGLPVPMIQGMTDGPFSEIGNTFFGTVGVFPFIGSVAKKSFQEAEQQAGRMFLENITTYAPLMKTSALSHSIYNQAAKVFNDNMALIGSKYDAFDRLADTVGNPAVIKLDKTVAKAAELKQQFSQLFPSVQRTFNAKNIEEVLQKSGDPVNLFYDAMDAIGTNMITPKQYKGVIQMLNNAIQGTEYKTFGRSLFVLREALENDLAAFGANLNKGTFLKDAGIREVYEGLAKSSPVRAEAFINQNIENATKLRDKLYDANTTFNKILNFYNSPSAVRTLQKFDRTLFTNKGTFGIVGREALPRDLLFETMERDVFGSNSVEALKTFKSLIGAAGKNATKEGKLLFDAAKARYMFNAFLESFPPGSSPQAVSIFRNTIDLAPGVKAGTEYAQDAMARLGTDSIERARGFRIEDVKLDNGVFNLKDIRFGPDDFENFQIGTFMKKLGLERATGDLPREKMIEMLGKEGASEFYKFTNYMKRLSDIPISDTATFLKRRFILGGSVAGGMIVGSGFLAGPFAPLVFILLARRAGRMLTDPVALRYMNDALLPEETLKLLKNKTIGPGQETLFGRTFFRGRSAVGKPTALGLTQKREAFARLYNYFADNERDLPRIDPKNIDPEEIRQRLLSLPYSIPQPIYDEKNIPKDNYETLFAGDFTKSSGEVNTDNDMVAYLDQTVAADLTSDVEEAERDAEADQMVTADLELQNPVQTQQPTAQVTSQQVQSLFPFDTTAIAAAQRRERGQG